jgi:hypothetical protein
MGELKKRKKLAAAQAREEFVAVQSMGGRMHVRWDDTAPATPHGQLVYFAQFLATAGIFDEWVNTCPLSYTRPNASTVHDVLGTLMMGILARENCMHGLMREGRRLACPLIYLAP